MIAVRLLDEAFVVLSVGLWMELNMTPLAFLFALGALAVGALAAAAIVRAVIRRMAVGVPARPEPADGPGPVDLLPRPVRRASAGIGARAPGGRVFPLHATR